MSRSLKRYDQPTISMRPPSGQVTLNLGQVWHYRDLLIIFTIRDVKLRYRQTALGILWVILQPLLGAGVLSVVFGKVAKLPSDGISYFVFAYAGMLSWTLFNNSMTKASLCFVQHAGLISKVFFPRLILPFSAGLLALVDFSSAFLIMMILIIIYGIPIDFHILFLPVWILLLLMIGVGIGLFTSTWMVRYRDFQYIVPVLTQLLFYASPVAYSLSAVPNNLYLFYFLNPLSGLIEATRWSLLHKGSLESWFLLYSAVMSIIIFVGGLITFKKAERGFADVI